MSNESTFWKKSPEPTISGLFEIISYDHQRGFGFVRTIGVIANYIHTGSIPGDIQILRRTVKLANLHHLQPGDVIEAEITSDGARPRVSSIISHEAGPNTATTTITVRVKSYSPEKGWGFLRGINGDIFFLRTAIEQPLDENQIVAGLYVRAGIIETDRGSRAVWIGPDQKSHKNSVEVSPSQSPKELNPPSKTKAPQSPPTTSLIPQTTVTSH